MKYKMNQAECNGRHLDQVRNLLSKYRSFLHKNRFALHIVEDLVSRCIFYYAPSSHGNNIDFEDRIEGDIDGKNQSKKRGRHTNHQDKNELNVKEVGGGVGGGSGGVMPESLYSWINLWTFMNDAIYYGLGNENGLTVGKLDEDRRNQDDGSTSNTHFSTIITTLRILLSIVDCLAPAIEVRAQYHQKYHPQETNHQNRHQQQSRLHVLNVLTKIERIRFLCRISILLLNYFHQYKKTMKAQKATSNNKQSMDKSYLAMFGIINDGGLLYPEENRNQTISAEQELKRVKRLLYVGKRTGRKVQASNTHQFQPRMTSHSNHPNDENHLLQGFTKRFDSTTFKICLLAFGEILHLSRPLFQTYALRQSEQQFQRHQNPHYNVELRKRRRMACMKTWIVSLLMDLISHQCTKLGTTVNVASSISGHGGVTNNHLVDIASPMTKDELYHRKMRLMLYLLRTPVFDVGTLPLAKMLSRVFSHVPLVGQLASNYVMDLLFYWHDWHFMTET